MNYSLFLLTKTASSPSAATCLGILLPDPRDLTSALKITAPGAGYLPGHSSACFQWEYAPHLNSNLSGKEDETYVRQVAFQIGCYHVKGDLALLTPPCLIRPAHGGKHFELEVEIQIDAKSLFHFAGFQSLLWSLSLGQYLHGGLFGTVDMQTVDLARRLTPMEIDCVPFVVDLSHQTIGVVELRTRLDESRFIASITALGDSQSINVGSVLRNFYSTEYDSIRFVTNSAFCTVVGIRKR